MRHLHLVIRGRVQGVGFRWFVHRHAEQLGVRGRVRNLPDGSVEVEAEGSETALRDLRILLGRGPSTAEVREVDEAWGEASGRWTRFEIG